MKNQDTNSFREVDQLKAQLDSYRPLSLEIVKNLHENLVLQWTYHSNAIEGNTLTLKETKVALEGITIGGKTLREHFEVINHRDAILYVEELVTKAHKLDEWAIKSLHQLVLKNVDDQYAGRYRQVNVIITAAEHRPPEAIHIAEQMRQLILWSTSQKDYLHPVEYATRLHGEFVKIHPFIDGNGRTARLLMNLALMQAGFPAIIIDIAERLDYYQTLDTADCTGDYSGFIELIINSLKKRFAEYRYVLGLESDLQAADSN